ncbi:uncharacterized protein PHACADRAFT_106961 [Phanerochaete carnosa HHB-10118-sp]|uniref:Uncharacterized protein n=1 Tax=Phanerochaete carnosa (strain HHB-10118-sp) TaxID=650164 RepID=K5VRL6_PHACS|nr:uncharacterized protein PHACADRAFT_106961 [Phanerochaete carnosa HHB-10118-sp]EKM49395.1 hypothetical protein PHACADRAFT_106961 [Phanerochaete carnosa HHB-10118-sp]
MQLLTLVQSSPFAPSASDGHPNWLDSTDSPTFDWWPDVARQIKSTNFIEYHAIRVFINSRNLNQRARSSDVSTTSGPGFRRVYVAGHPIEGGDVCAKLNNFADGLLREGDFISMWMGRRSGPRREWIERVGQVVRFRVLWQTHITAEVHASHGSRHFTVFLTFRICDILPPSAIASSAWKRAAAACEQYIERPCGFQHTPLPPPPPQAPQPAVPSVPDDMFVLAGDLFDMEAFGVAPASLPL